MKVSPAWAASGVKGFFGSDKYWYQKVGAFIGMWFLWITFVSKTSTFAEREGNMPRSKNGLTPREWVPRCIIVKWRKRAVLNAVGLSGPGLEFLLSKGLWQKRRKDFFISLMSVAPTLEERKEEIRKSLMAIRARRWQFRVRVGIQLNVSCPNVGAAYHNIVAESDALLDVLHEIDPSCEWVVIVKLSPTVKAADAALIAQHRRCDGLCIANTLPYGELSHRVNWISIFGSATSPLLDRGFKQAGGYSGKELCPIICDLIKEIRDLGVRKHINGCGGILGPVSAFKVLRAGADSISIGSCAILAPWGVLPAIITAHIVNWYRRI